MNSKRGEQKRRHNNVLPNTAATAKDDRHTPEWDIKMQREFEAKNPGPSNRRLRKKTTCITISDDEPEDQQGRMDDDWTAAIWDELIKDKPEHWNLRDALRLGRTRGEDPSLDKVPDIEAAAPRPQLKKMFPRESNKTRTSSMPMNGKERTL